MVRPWIRQIPINLLRKRRKKRTVLKWMNPTCHSLKLQGRHVTSKHLFSTHAHIFFPRIFPSNSSSCVTACLKMKTWVLSNDSYQEVRLRSYFLLKNFMTRERRATLTNDVKFPGEGISGRWVQLNEGLTNLNLFRRNCSALQQILV